MNVNPTVNIYAKFDEANSVWRVIAEQADGTNVVLGKTPTEKGAKRMVTVHKKFHKLV
jgi:hypothetical protein